MKITKIKKASEEIKKSTYLSTATIFQIDDEYLLSAKFANQHWKVEAIQPIQLLEQVFATQLKSSSSLIYFVSLNFLCVCAPVSNAHVWTCVKLNENNQNSLEKSL